MLGKDSVRASLRVDYSGYVDEDDEENIVYEDNTISHKKPLLPVSNDNHRWMITGIFFFIRPHDYYCVARRTML
jgi:hypothetical protein